ncbi:hypothetical protein EST38_g3662 [Candolleomyces aberdarensis]|uniref:ATP-dependent DNA helicase II subunit 1 n=1 Tax=Candolleomyces aberdarensis TaxID=2316362 RepID=A0A4Q2DRH5_9AGAR|nr:hypothetical protein EST38_g3662 [Candolleomyces aberdarensis]
MSAYDDWNKIDEEDDEELQDTSMFEGKRDVILFCIDCSESMLQLYDDPKYEDVKTCHLFAALEAAMQIEKKKIIVGPNDSVGIMLFNTTRKSENGGYASEIKKGTYLFQPISLLSAPKVQEIIQLLDAHEMTFSPIQDLTQAGVNVEPFFISTPEKPFDVSKFYSSVLLPTNLDEDDSEGDSTILPESISISKIEDLLAQMRFHEVPKRALFSAPFKLGDGFTIGVKGYGLVTEQKKGSYQYFVDLGDRMEVAKSKTVYVDQDREEEVDRSKIVYGASGGAAPANTEDDGGDADDSVGSRKVKAGHRPFYTPDEIRSFRTMGLETGALLILFLIHIQLVKLDGSGVKLLGFKDKTELNFEDNIKHSYFLYPDEMAYSGSKRTFNALLKSMVKKDKIALALALTRRNASPIFCYLLPQEEKVDESGWTEPPGFHIIPLPFADDMRAAPIEEGHRASDSVVEAAKLLLEAAAFREEYDPDTFEDLTEPNSKAIHRKAGEVMKAWKEAVESDNTSSIVDTPATTGSKRKADVSVNEAEIRSHWENGTLAKLKVDQLKEFLKSKSQTVSGKKADLMERVGQWFETH